jgi:peroxiredoxin
MAINKMQAELIGKTIPMDTGRSDEGTPVSLYDFKGRSLAVFLSGEGLTKKNKALIKRIKDATDEFLKYDCSPIWISTESEELLSAARQLYDLPYMIISDFSKEIHDSLGFDFNSQSIDVILSDDEGKIVYTVPSMEPLELVNATLSALDRVFVKSN